MRSLGELTTCRNEIGLPTVRNLLINLFSLKLLFSFADASKAADLAAALTQLLERFEYGEIARGACRARSCEQGFRSSDRALG